VLILLYLLNNSVFIYGVCNKLYTKLLWRKITKTRKEKIMNTHIDQTQENKSQSVANAVSPKQNRKESTFQFVDNRPEAIAQRKLQDMANNSPQVSQLMAFQDMANNSPQVKQAAQLQAMVDNHSSQQQQPIQKKENNTGLPDNLKTGMENLSGMSLDDVKVHRNSDKPAQLQAYAYAQGTDIHLGPRQEKHLPHEAWHVVQQKQGRVKPTMQMKGKVSVNDDAGLEKEADVMGAKALSQSSKEQVGNEIIKESNHNVTQLKIWKGKLGADATLYTENDKKANLPARIKQGSDLEHDDTKVPPKNKKHANFPKAAMANGTLAPVNKEGYVLAHKVILVDEDRMFDGGVGKSSRHAWAPDEHYLSDMDATVAACDYIDEYIEAAMSSEQDVEKWRKRAIGLGASNAVAGGTMLGLGIAAAIVASGGTLLIPLAIAGGVVAVTGIGSGVSKAGMNQSLKGGGHSKKQAGAVQTGKAAVIPGAKAAVLEGVKAASGEAAKATAAAIAAPVGGAFTAGMAMNDVRKAVKVNPKDVWKSLDWNKIKDKLRADKLRLEKLDAHQSLSTQYRLTITRIETTLSKIKNT
jgi:hypothetical protein